MTYHNIREEELKNQIARDYFSDFDTTKIVGNIDFCVTHKTNTDQDNLFETQSLLWAEAKKGKSDIHRSIVQLILTIGKARTFDKILPPAFIGAFDAENIAFVPYSDVHNIFYINDFNWSVTPSNHETKEFQLILDKVQSTIQTNSLLFTYTTDDKEIREFIKINLVIGKTAASKICIDKNNFISIYSKWLTAVKPSIIPNWDIAKKSGIIDGDFYLADLLSSDNQSLKESLYVLLKDNHYEIGKKLNEMGMFSSQTTNFNDNQKAHQQFWNRYERPPHAEYWDYIINRRDLLVPQDVRERKGSFFTPQIWVDKSQEYLKSVLGDNWQDEHYIWDCAAGTGNLLAGLTNKYNIWASTLDTQDVDVMHERINTMNEESISGQGANLLADHCFQFDFLNDEFTKLPQGLQDIIANPVKRQKLVIYINPPYAETMGHGEKSKIGLNLSKVNDKYKSKLGKSANRELFIQFFTRIYFEIPDCVIAEFSTLKALQSPNFIDFRNFFIAKLESCFVVPADTFDNVKGQFPIGFKIWNTSKKEKFENVMSDIFDRDSVGVGSKLFLSYDGQKSINQWLISTRKRTSEKQLGFISCLGNDFQQNNVVFVMNRKEQMKAPRGSWITDKNLREVAVYFSARKSMEATWLNDRDQFLFPSDGWMADTEFQNDCLAYTLFHGQNRISGRAGVNHWTPFTETEVNSRDKFASSFMTDFMKGKLGLKEKKRSSKTPLTEDQKMLLKSILSKLNK